MTLRSKVLLAINPFSPVNWIVAIILYFTLKKKLEREKATKSTPIKWGILVLTYLVILIPVYMVLCAVAKNIPPLRILALFCRAV